MKMLEEFFYFTPQSVQEAVLLLAKYKGEGRVLAGGTDLLVMMKDRVITPKYLIDLKSISAIDILRWDLKEGLRTGALTRISNILNSDVIREKYFCLHQAAESLGTVQVRNMATIGGNICRSSPSADMVPPLLVFDAKVTLVGPESERTILLEDFFTGPGGNVLNNEILTEIKILPQKRPSGTAFRKLGRSSEDLAKVNCAVNIMIANGKCEDVRIALGAVAPMPIRAKKVEEALRGQKVNSKAIGGALGKVAEDIAPITDVRSSAEYRTYVSRILIGRVVDEAMKNLGAKLDA